MMELPLYCLGWDLLVPIWKYLFSIFVALSIHYEDEIFMYLWCCMLLIAVFVDIGVSTHIIDTKYGSHDTEGPLPLLSTEREDDPESFFKATYFTLSAIELKLYVIQLLLLFIATVLHVTAWMSNESNYSLFLISSLLFLVYIILYCYIQIKKYYWISGIAWAVVYSLLFIWMFCLSLAHDFDVPIDSSVLTILFVIFFVTEEIVYDATLTGEWEGSGRCGCCFYPCSGSDCCCVIIPKCYQLGFFITFLVMIFSTNQSIFYVFMFVWIMWLFQLCQILASAEDKYPRKTQIDLDKNVIVSRVQNENLLVDLDRILAQKRASFGKDIRLRCLNAICDIISPNHVALTSDGYNHYANEFLIADSPITSRYDDTKPSAIQFDGTFFQWIPTQFQLKFKDDYDHNSRDVADFLDIELYSKFIPDINCCEYAQCYEYIVQLLRESVVSLFADNDTDTLLAWCGENKILSIIVKSQQYEFTEEALIDPFGHGETSIHPNGHGSYHGAYHVEGSAQQKIQKIALVYTHVDETIIGGDLCLKQMMNTRAGYPFMDTIIRVSNLRTGAVVLFRNTEHKMDMISLVDEFHTSDDNPPVRRFIAFFLCVDMEEPNELEMYYKSRVYRYLARDDNAVEPGEEAEYWLQQRQISKLKIITATDMCPVIKANFIDFMQLELRKYVLSIFELEIPKNIVQMIAEYMVDSDVVREERDAQVIADDFRKCAGHTNVRRGMIYTPIMCD
eukprot:42619_1